MDPGATWSFTQKNPQFSPNFNLDLAQLEVSPKKINLDLAQLEVSGSATFEKSRVQPLQPLKSRGCDLCDLWKVAVRPLRPLKSRSATFATFEKSRVQPLATFATFATFEKSRVQPLKGRLKGRGSLDIKLKY